MFEFYGVWEISNLYIERRKMKKIISLILAIAFVSPVMAQTFSQPAYKMGIDKVPAYLTRKLTLLYEKDEDKRELNYEYIRSSTRLSLKEGDSFLALQVITDFILGKNLPDLYEKDEDYRDEINSLREQMLEFLISEAQDDEFNISAREFAIQKLSQVATAENLPDFDFNIDAIGAIESLAGSEKLALKHSAMVGVKNIVLKTNQKWEDAAITAAEILASDLSSSNIEIQRIAFFECLDLIQKSGMRTEAIVKIWEATASALGDIQSPSLQEHVKDLLVELTKAKTGPMFREQVRAVKEELNDLEDNKKLNKEPIEELLVQLKDEDDPVELEAILDRLLKESSKQRSLLYVVYSKLMEASLQSEASLYKIRKLNSALIQLTHDTNSPLFYYRTALFFTGEISIFKNSDKANIPISMLGNMLSSTDQSELLLPIINELKLAVDSELPVWIQRRLITLMFMVAGDTSNELVGVNTTKVLKTVADSSDKVAVRYAAFNRISLLVKHAKEDKVKETANFWR